MCALAIIGLVYAMWVSWLIDIFLKKLLTLVSLQHDVGNPLTIHGKLMGMSFHSHGCSHPEYPGVYTSVPAHVDWIKTHSAE